MKLTTLYYLTEGEIIQFSVVFILINLVLSFVYHLEIIQTLYLLPQSVELKTITY